MAFGRVGALGTGFSRLGAGRHLVSGAAVGGAALLTGETNGFAADFTYATDASRVAVKTAGTVVSSGLSFFTNGGTSSKWVYNAAGTLVNVAVGSLAVDYDPGTLVAKGLLCEPQATNLMALSADLGNWGVSGVTATTNTTTSPAGVAEADTATFTASALAYAYNPISTTSAAAYTFSIFVKTASGTKKFRLALQGTGTTYSAELTATTTWQRFSHTFTADVTGTSYCLINNDVAATAGSMFVWGMQIEAGTVATSPIPTLGAGVTRAADNITFLLSAIPALGTAYSMYTRFSTPSVASAKHVFAVTDGTLNEFSGFAANTTARLAVVDGGSAVGAISQGTITANTALSVAGRFQANNCALSTAGAAVATDVTVTLPTVTQVRYGGDGSNAAATAVFYIEKQIIVPRGWSNAELAVQSAT